MSSSPSQGNPPCSPSPPSSTSSGRLELTIEGRYAFSELLRTATLCRTSYRTGDTPSIRHALAAIQLGTANMLSPFGYHAVGHASTESALQPQQSTTVYVSSAVSTKMSVKKKFKLWKTNRNSMEPSDIAPIMPELTPHSLDQRASITTPEANINPVSLGSYSLAPTAQVAAVTTKSPVDSSLPSSTTTRSLRLDIFSANVTRYGLVTDLPKSCARIESTAQLVYSCSVLAKAHIKQPPVSDSEDIQELPLDDSQREWVQYLGQVEQDRLHWLVDQLVKAFAEDQLKGSEAITEIVLVGPVLDRMAYRGLLACFISKFEQTTPLDLNLLQGIVQLVECASSAYLVDDDLVRITTVISKDLSVTHNGTSDHPLYLTWALSRVLDVLVAGNVKDLNRDRDHQPMLQLLATLKKSGNTYLKYQAAYAYQALQYAPDDETPLQVLWRYTQVAAASASGIASVFKLDPLGFLEGMENLQQIGGGVVDVFKAGVEGMMAGIDGVKALREGGGSVVRAAEKRINVLERRSWYLALQGTALFIRQGRLSDFNRVICESACRRSANFQWGICRQLGEIAVDPLWDPFVRQQAVSYLGELYSDGIYWKTHVDIKRWILTILVQISELPDASLKSIVLALLADLKEDGTLELQGSFPLSNRLPLPVTFPLLVQVQGIPSVEYDLDRLRKQRLGEYKQSIYIDPMAKPTLQASDDTLFPLMNMVKDFLSGDSEVMLILGDSGAGKSMFNRYLENELWKEYKSGGRIPLFINLPALERTEKELVAEQLRTYDFRCDQIRELKKHRQFILICDGYDESQLTSNLHTTNLLNRAGQWEAKLLITCRTQYLGPDYRGRFVPLAPGKYNQPADNLFLEAVITPFSKEQIEDYVERYVPLEPRTWVKKDYMDKLETIPNLMDLVKNPFLLTLCLEALPNVVQGRSDLSKLRVTRVQLYDNFVWHWLRANKCRLQEHRLDKVNRLAFEVLLDDGFEQNGIKFQQDLAAAIFREQDGRPIVDYTERRDRASWKAAFFGHNPNINILRGASLLRRAGTQHRFVHRSILEYFYSRTIYGPVDSSDEFAPHPCANFSDISNHPLSQRSLVVEPSIIQFLAERVQLHSGFKKQLLGIIELSKIDEQAARAAANAITVLVKAGVSFNRADLRGVRVPGADLSGGKFDSARMQEADLRGVNLTRSWIRQADLTKARMKEVVFGELPFLKEEDTVCSCAYSADGKLFAVGLLDGTINVYDTKNWTEPRPLLGHKGEVTATAFSPSGQQLLSGSHDCTLSLWNLQEGSQHLFWEGHRSGVTDVAFSPSGDQFASGSYDNTVRLWDSHTGNNTLVLQGHTKWVQSVAYSPDGLKIVSGGLDGMILIFDTHSGHTDLVLKNGKGAAPCVAYSSDGHWIAAGGSNGELQLWNSRTGTSGKQWRGHESGVTAVDFSPDTKWIASSSLDCTVKLWDVYTGVLVSDFAGHTAPVDCVAFSPNGLQLASGSIDKTVRLWDVTTTAAGLDLDSYQDDTITGVAYSSDGRILISGGESGTVRLYDAVTGWPGPMLQCGYDNANCLAISSDGLRVATAGRDSFVRTWNAESGAREFTLEGHTDSIEALRFSPEGQWIASGSWDNTVRLWCARSGTPGRVLSGHSGGILSLTFSLCGLQVVSGSIDGETRVWDMGTGESRVIVNVSYGLQDIAISSTVRQVALVGDDSTEVELWDEEGGEPMQILEHDGSVFLVSMSPCGQWIASAFEDVMWIWNLVWRGMEEEWEYVLTIGDFHRGVSCVDWRPNELEFVTGSSSGFVQVWRLDEESDGRFSAWLMWTSGRTAFTAMDTVIVDTVDLSETNQRLLKQRGAKDGSEIIDDTLYEGQDENQDESQDDYWDEDQDDYSDGSYDDYSDEDESSDVSQDDSQADSDTE